MNRNEILTILAIEMAEWPKDTHVPPGFFTNGFGYIVYKDTGNIFTKGDWLTERARLINKPSWDDAPEYAEWLAQDADGEWFWYLDMPKSLNGIWAGPAVLGQPPIQGALPAGHDWRETLEQRPVETIPPEDTVDTSELHWDGEAWPPPEGTLVEVRLDNEADFHEAEVVLVGKSLSAKAPTVAAVETASGEIVLLASCHMGSNIRSIRTPEQRAAEVLAQRISDFYGSKVPEEYLCLARELIRDGYRNVQDKAQKRAD